MPTVDEVASAHYLYQAALLDELNKLLTQAWVGVQAADVLGSWAAVGPRVTDLVTIGQYTAAAAAGDYVAAALQAQGVNVAPVAVDPRAFAGVASDGRGLGSLLLSSPLTALEQIAAGAGLATSLESGLANLIMHAGTQISDAGRVADQTAMAATPQAKLWVRMVEAGACSRCVVLAGQTYRWKADFLRHPSCRCRAIPQAEDTGDMTTDPQQYFDALPASEQNRIFTNAGAEAIRSGADIGQVVNARRGMHTATPRTKRESWAKGRMTPADVHGRPAFITNEGVTRRGLAGQQQLIKRNGGVRLMPEQIFRDATSRQDAVRLLKAHGYIL